MQKVAVLFNILVGGSNKHCEDIFCNEGKRYLVLYKMFASHISPVEDNPISAYLLSSQVSNHYECWLLFVFAYFLVCCV